MTRGITSTALALMVTATVLATGASADVASFQARQADPFIVAQNFLGTETTYMRSGQSNNNFGAATSVVAGAPTLTNVFRPLFRFSIEDSFNALLAANPGMQVVVTSAVMTLNVDGRSGSASQTAAMYAMPAADGNWVEGSGMYNTQEGTACWNYRAWSATSPLAWSMGAGMGYGEATDVPDTFLDSNVITATGNQNFDVPAALAQTWLSSATNYGVIVVNENEYTAGDSFSFRTEDHSYGTPPKLDITYDLIPIPEPASMALLALGGLTMIRHRRSAR